VRSLGLLCIVLDEPIWGFLVLTDEASEDTGALYATEQPSVGDSSVSIPIDLQGFAGAWPIPVRMSVRDPGAGRPGDLWSGTLSLPSGTLLASDQSMSPMGRLDLFPGRYHVDVDRPTTPDGAFEVRVQRTD
jgi:hypothetical protein